MPAGFTRRELLVTGAKASVGASVVCVPLVAAADASATTFVRRDVGALGASDPIIVSYRNAVQAMQALPDTDPLSWTYQAAIHWTTALSLKPAWDTCEHGSPWFWPWHRMYLYYFERIVRKLSGNPSWALPYWNYESPSERQLPLPFRDPASALYTTHRGFGWNSGSASLSSAQVDTSLAFAPTDFLTASSVLEGTPHGAVHLALGGWMHDVETAAQDPIFFLHHANIDRLWNAWLAQGSRDDPLDDAGWKAHSFQFFDENRNAVHLTPCAVLRCAQQLGYTYENEPPQVSQNCIKFVIPWKYAYLSVIHFPLPPVELNQKVTFERLDVRKIRDRLASLAANKSETLVLKLENVVAARSPGVSWQVYLGAPSRAKLTPHSPFFVGNVALFGMGIRSVRGRKFMPATIALTADRAVQAGLRANPNGVLPLVFVPSGPLINGRQSVPKVQSKVTIGKVSIVDVSRRSKRR